MLVQLFVLVMLVWCVPVVVFGVVSLQPYTGVRLFTFLTSILLLLFSANLLGCFLSAAIFIFLCLSEILLSTISPPFLQTFPAASLFLCLCHLHMFNRPGVLPVSPSSFLFFRLSSPQSQYLPLGCIILLLFWPSVSWYCTRIHDFLLNFLEISAYH